MSEEKSPDSGEAFARIPVFGGTNIHVDKPEKPEYYRKDFMCRCSPRRFKDTEFVEKTIEVPEGEEYDRKYRTWEKDSPEGVLKFYRDVAGEEKYEPSEGLKRCVEVLEEVYRRLDADAANLLSRVITSLNWDYSAHITGIENDMWSGISAETYSVTYPEDHVLTGIVDGSYFCQDCREHREPDVLIDGRCPEWEPQTKLKVYVECDSLEDGIARVWKFFADELDSPETQAL